MPSKNDATTRTNSGPSVSRHRFVQSIEASGPTVAFSGYSAARREQVAVQWISRKEEAKEQEAFNQACYDAGVSDSIEVEFSPDGDVIDDRWRTDKSTLDAY